MGRCHGHSTYGRPCCRREEGSSDTAHRNAYRQLRLHTPRQFPKMIRQSLRKDLRAAYLVA